MTKGPLLTHEETVYGTGNGDQRTHIDARHEEPKAPEVTTESASAPETVTPEPAPEPTPDPAQEASDT